MRGRAFLTTELIMPETIAPLTHASTLLREFSARLDRISDHTTTAARAFDRAARHLAALADDLDLAADAAGPRRLASDDEILELEAVARDTRDPEMLLTCAIALGRVPGRMSQDDAREECAALLAIRRGIREILADRDRGAIPAVLDTFADLHVYVDANEYGGLTDGGLDPACARDLAFSNRVQSALDVWIRAGGLRAQTPTRREA
jgi:hypothetical protein